jgi:hypothetical protein
MTANYSKLNISFDYNEKMEIEGFTRISDVWCSESSVKHHDEELRKIADERNGGVTGSIVRYGSPHSKTEWYAAPELKVFWSSDWE